MLRYAQHDRIVNQVPNHVILSEAKELYVFPYRCRSLEMNPGGGQCRRDAGSDPSCASWWRKDAIEDASRRRDDDEDDEEGKHGHEGVA
jgi:hypothetical protein